VPRANTSNASAATAGPKANGTQPAAADAATAAAAAAAAGASGTPGGGAGSLGRSMEQMTLGLRNDPNNIFNVLTKRMQALELNQSLINNWLTLYVSRSRFA
jgi:hypothetical protein